MRGASRARFVIWGDGPLRADLEALIRAKGLTGSAEEMREATREPERVLTQRHIFVLPSLSEASSNVVLDAMATACPSWRRGSGLVGDHRSGLLVPPDNAQALAQAIFKLLENPLPAARVGAQGCSRALAELGMNRMLERIDTFYCRALGPSHGAPAPRQTVQHA